MRFIAAALLLLPALAAAQVVSGIAVDRNGIPVPGVVVQLVDSTSAVLGRALSNERGEFRLLAANPGTYRLHTLRIGFRPQVSGALTLVAGETTPAKLVLSSASVTLDTVRVGGASACRMATDSAAATFAVWEQARAALTAAQLTGGRRTIVATTVGYVQNLDPDSRQVRQERTEVHADSGTKPWSAAAPDSLHRTGYIVKDKTGDLTYRAPDVDVLLSSEFVEDHCLRLARADDPALIGVAFEPTDDRRHLAEIRGTLWLDRASAELRNLEYGYANATREQEQIAGGKLTFARLGNGAWVVSRWRIQMPVMEIALVGVRARLEPRLGEIRVTGGELALATAGRDTIWSRAWPYFAGTVVDTKDAPVTDARVSLLGTGVATTTDSAGRFRFESIAPGTYAVEVHTASLDSLGVVNRTLIEFQSVATPVRIHVAPAAQLVAAYCGNFNETTHGVPMSDSTARPAAALCGGVFSGSVMADSTRAPVVGASVVVADLGITVATGADGSFRVDRIPAGAHRIGVRRVGFGALDTTLMFRPGEHVERRIFLSRIVTLDSVVSTAHMTVARQHFVDDINERRRQSLGYTIDSTGMAGRYGLDGVFPSFPRTTVTRGRNGEYSITFPDDRGGQCAAILWVDGTRLDDTSVLRDLIPEDVAAIEVYPNGFIVPAQFMSPKSLCGAIVVWTKRFLSPASVPL